MTGLVEAGPAAAHPPANAQRILYIDGWRAIAVLFVISTHAMANLFYVDASSIGLGGLGLTGVYIFFLISGYIITSLALAEKRATGAFSQTNFLVRRCLRILPPLFLYIAAMLVLAPAPTTPPSAIRAATFTCNIALGNQCSWYFGHTWSLAFEEQFYLLFPFIALRRFNILILPAIAFYLMPLFFPIDWIGQMGHLQISALFALGAAYAVYQEKVHAFLARFPFALLLAAVVFVGWWFELPPSILQVSLAALIPPAIFLVVFGLPARVSLFRAFLSNPVFTRLGLWSYSIYLWQQYFFRFGAGETVGVALISLVSAIAVAGVSYHTYEWVFRRISRRFSRAPSSSDSRTAEAAAYLPARDAP